MKKRILVIALIGLSFKMNAQNETVNGTLTVNGSIEVKKSQTSTNYPNQTSRGDIFQLYQNENNTLEIGVGGNQNTRRSWILSRHSDLGGSYGKYYSTLHLQPDTGDKTQYKGIAIGFNPSWHVSTGTHLAVNGNVGIGTIDPEAKLTINGLDSEGWNSGIGLLRSGVAGRILIDTEGMKFRNMNSGKNFIFRNSLNQTTVFIKDNGFFGIGTTTPDAKLAVNGKIHTKEVKVDLVGWSDFVLKKDYKLPTLVEVEKHIKEKGHLKDIPSEKEVLKNGIHLGEMNAKLLQKIEELTLYTIQQEKNLKKHNSKIEKLEKENESLKFLATKFLELQKRLEKLEKS